MKNLSLILGLDQHNIVDSIGSAQFQDVPNSIKSMLVLAATPEVNQIGDSDLDALRPVMTEQDGGTNETLISFHLEGENTPPYQQTYDTMKKYAKFMAMWMNYKEISVVEYLGSFDTVEERYENISGETVLIDTPRLKLPVWRKMEPNILSNLSEDQKIICRIRKYSAQEYLRDILTTKMRSYNNTYGDGFLSNEDVFDLPIYNQFFILSGRKTPSEDSEPETQQGKTTENECHNHAYNIDPKGNGWTSYAVHPDNPNVRHRHRILNYVVQSAASDCYPNCEIKYGIKGAMPHGHEILTTEENEETQQVQGMTSMQSANNTEAQAQNTVSMASVTGNGASY